MQGQRLRSEEILFFFPLVYNGQARSGSPTAMNVASGLGNLTASWRASNGGLVSLAKAQDCPRVKEGKQAFNQLKQS